MDIIAWIKSQVMEFINGKMVGFIKEILITTYETDSDSFMKEKI